MSHRISDLVDLDQFFGVMLKPLYEATGIPFGLADDGGNPGCVTGWQEVCTKFHGGRSVLADGGFVYSRCPLGGISCAVAPGRNCECGLKYYATPLLLEGCQIATLLLGPVFFDPPRLDDFRRYAREFGIDEAASLAAVCKVPIVAKERVESLMAFYVQLAQTLAADGLGRLRGGPAELLGGRQSLVDGQQIALLGSWDWDIAANSVEWSDTAAAIFTSDRGSTKFDFEDFKRTIHPDDLDRMFAAVKASIDHDVPFEIDHRIVSKTEGVRVVHAQGRVYRDDAGKPVRMVGTVHDVTAWKHAEAELRASAETLRITASVFEAAHEGIAITDPAGLILDVNRAFCQITGYPRGELVGKRPSILASGCQDRAFYQTMWDSLKSRGAWSGEVVNRRKSGELFTVNLDIVAVNDCNGLLSHHVGIFSDISQLKQHEQHLQYIAQHDVLTGLPNRLLLTDRLLQGITQARRAGNMLVVFYLDLDGFKPINDTYGHETGDRVLAEMARRLSDALREGDTVARIGGDEFVALLSGIESLSECELAAQRVLAAITPPIFLDGGWLNLTASIGISVFPDDGCDDADTLLRCADQAMYSAKAAGRNQFAFYSSDVPTKPESLGLLVHDLRRATNEGQISVHYQPIVDMATGEVVKAEALVRWVHPVRGCISPAEFIPLAESSGLIQSIGDFVFTEAVRVAKTWNDIEMNCGDGMKRISINRSPRQFFHRDGISAWIRHLEDSEIPGQCIAVEITEGLLLVDRPDVMEQLHALREFGVAISLDDFGTGYSALSYLKKFEIDYLKIDRSFVCDITRDEDDRAIVEAIIVMARRLGIATIAEGVETCEQVELLSEVGCHLAQGFYYAKPMPEAEFLAFVQGHQGEASLHCFVDEPARFVPDELRLADYGPPD